MGFKQTAKAVFWALVILAAGAGGVAGGIAARHLTYTLGFQDGYDKGYADGAAANPPPRGEPIDWENFDPSKIKGSLRTGPPLDESQDQRAPR